jgi:hypothetical protein
MNLIMIGVPLEAKRISLCDRGRAAARRLSHLRSTGAALSALEAGRETVRTRNTGEFLGVRRVEPELTRQAIPSAER